MANAQCAWCRKVLKPEEVRRVPVPLAWMTAFAMAFMHGGLWANEELRRPYCAPCRARIAPMAVALTAVIACGVGFGLRLWLRGP